ncbi:hypothetical protein N0V90_000101 [Kalmusia sp. IMI 367209]|nr:hypothetical protein N0V90_000101 [Kalmusia sp. IMI 367209]
MGSRISKAVHQHKAAASPWVAASHHNKQQTEPRQATHGHDSLKDDATATSLATHDTPASPAPAASGPDDDDDDDDDDDAMDINQRPRTSTDFGSAAISEDFVLLPGGVAGDEPLPLPQSSIHGPPPPRSCLICCNPCGGPEKDSPELINPCKCNSVYCAPCLKGMFVEACKNVSRMPPRCCNQIPLYHARPYLTNDEAAEFRAKYEEWGTPKPFYCPVARCSAFIPNRLLPQTRTNSKGKQRVDSGIGTPKIPIVTCPKCEADLCTRCRSLAHPNGTCSPLEFGIDQETAELLKKWGYKRCPKCGNGVKRMYGCNHMECRCGAHFCWVCLKGRDECDEGCYDDDDDDDYDSQDEPDEEQDEGNLQPEVPIPTEPNLVHVFPHMSQGETSEDPSIASAIPTTEVSQTATTELPTDPTTEQPPSLPRVRNLDAGSGRYWEEQDMDFGHEPTDDIQDSVWNCTHNFHTAKIKLKDAFVSPNGGMECMKCWATVHPEVLMPPAVKTGGLRTTFTALIGRQSQGRGRGGRAHGSRTRVLRPNERNTLRVARSMEELQIPHSPIDDRPASSPLCEPMQDVHYSFQQPASPKFDLYGYAVVSTEKAEDTRRCSLDTDKPDCDVQMRADDGEAKPLSFATHSTPFSFAYNCYYCGLLVCDSCREALLDAGDED